MPILYVRHIFLILLFIAWPWQSLLAKEAPITVFFDSLYDVPVMPGLVEVPELSMSFDKPDGRISEASAHYNGAKVQAVFVFYDQSLSQMGWRKQAQGIYTREGEKLSISIEKMQENQGALPLVRFLLEPQ